MRWPWSRRERVTKCEVDGCDNPAVEWGRSPFDADVIREGDPGWEVFDLAMKTGKPVMGIYDAETGEIVSMKTLVDDDPHIGRATNVEEIPEQPDRFGK